jgi:hypothetical protein
MRRPPARAAYVGQDGVDGGRLEQRHTRRGGVIENDHAQRLLVPQMGTAIH